MLLINFNLEHGICEGLKNLTLYLDLVLFWHSFLSLAAGLTLFLYLLVYLLNSLLHLIMIAKSTKWQQLTLLQPTTNYSTNFNACPENSSCLGICHPERSERSRADLWVTTRIPGYPGLQIILLKYRHLPR